MPGNSTEKDSCIRAATNWIHTHPKLSWREFKVNKLNFRITGGKAVIRRGKRTRFWSAPLRVDRIKLSF